MPIVIVKQIIKYWKLSLLIAILLIAGVGYYISTQFTPPSPSTNTLELPYTDIHPGTTTHQQLIDAYGVFTSEYADGDYLVYTYPSHYSRYAPDKFYLRQDIVYMKELYFNPLQYVLPPQKIYQTFGQPTTTMYTDAAIGAYNSVLVYPDLGVAAYVINDMYTTRIQYFAPLSLQTFKDVWGKNLRQSKPQPATQSPHTK